MLASPRSFATQLRCCFRKSCGMCSRIQVHAPDPFRLEKTLGTALPVVGKIVPTSQFITMAQSLRGAHVGYDWSTPLVHPHCIGRASFLGLRQAPAKCFSAFRTRKLLLCANGAVFIYASQCLWMPGQSRFPKAVLCENFVPMKLKFEPQMAVKSKFIAVPLNIHLPCDFCGREAQPTNQQGRSPHRLRTPTRCLSPTAKAHDGFCETITKAIQALAFLNGIIQNQFAISFMSVTTTSAAPAGTEFTMLAT